MKNLSEIKESIINFWEIEEDKERDKLIEKIKEYANAKEEQEFITEVRNTFEQIRFSGISVIYEALSENPKKWGRFFKEEYERAFNNAAYSENKFEILECLEEIGFAEENEVIYKEEIIKLLSTYLTSKNDVLRYKSIWIIGDWIAKENTHKYESTVRQIQSKLKDNNWKIRYITTGVLEDMGALPKGYKMSFMDTVKRKLLNPYEMK